MTLGIDSDAAVAAGARRYADWPLIKVKVDGERHVEVVRLVHGICPAARIIVDPNQAWSCDLLNRLAPEMQSLGVVLIEQPVPRGEDESLRAYSGAIRLAADESVSDRAGLAKVKDLYQVVNVKLDKTGGLTEALALARDARGLGLQGHGGLHGGNLIGHGARDGRGATGGVRGLGRPAVARRGPRPWHRVRSGFDAITVGCFMGLKKMSQSLVGRARSSAILILASPLAVRHC
jgi:hypothetical protein